MLERLSRRRLGLRPEGAVRARSQRNIMGRSSHEFLTKLRQYAPEYLKLNPKAVVPTLVHDGHVVRELTVICEYIEDVSPQPN